MNIAELKAAVGSENVRIDTGKIFIYNKLQHAYIFFCDRIALKSVTYEDIAELA